MSPGAPHEPARLQVTGHIELAGRGTVLVGHIIGGVFRIGMSLRTSLADHPILTLSAVEFLDNIVERKFWNGLLFRENPSLEVLRELFPAGSVACFPADPSPARPGRP